MRRIIIVKFNFVFIYLVLTIINPVFAANINIELSVDLSDEDKQNIIDNLSLYQYKESPFANKDYVESLISRGKTEIQTMLQTFGYFKSEVSVSSERQDDNLLVKYSINLGPPVIVNEVTLQISGEGNKDPELTAWIKDFPLKKGDVLSQLKYEDAKKNILQLLRDRGYFSSKLNAHKIAVDLKTFSADITLEIDSGARYVFGATSFIQNDYDEGYLNRFLNYKEGDYYDAKVIEELQKRLISSQEFLSVEINPEITAARDLHVPIKIRLLPQKKWRFSFGAGYDSDLGVQGSASVSQRRFTRRGHQAGAETTLSRLKKQVQVHYQIPAKRPWSDYYSIAYDFTEEDTEDTSRYTNSVISKFVRVLDSVHNIFSLSYDNEVYVIGKTPSQRSQVFVPSFAIQYLPLENAILKNLNLELYTEIRGASTNLASDVDFTQTISNGKFNYRFLNRWRVVSRLDVAFTDIADFDKLPVSYRFFAGGDYSVRGYKYNSLSPTDDQGNYIGGRNLLVGSVELRYRFLPQWDTAIFYDIGNAYDIGKIDLKAGAGIGIGWIYTLFSIRVYAANALDLPDRPWRFSILLGTAL